MTRADVTGSQGGAICLTGDVHQSALGGIDQRLAGVPEPWAVERYLEVASQAGLAVTLFATASAVLEAPAIFTAAMQDGRCALAAHGYSALQPTWLHFGLRRFTGSPWAGLVPWQRREMRGTIRVFRETLGVRPVAWRTHAYAADASTARLLRAEGVTVWSDRVGGVDSAPRLLPSGIWDVPINVPPDHESVPHWRGRPQRRYGRVVPGPRYASADTWVEAVLTDVRGIVERGAVATLLVHPLCMYLLDDFRTFAALCTALSAYRSITLADLGGEFTR